MAAVLDYLRICLCQVFLTPTCFARSWASRILPPGTNSLDQAPGVGAVGGGAVGGGAGGAAGVGAGIDGNAVSGS